MCLICTSSSGDPLKRATCYTRARWQTLIEGQQRTDACPTAIINAKGRIQFALAASLEDLCACARALN